MIWKWFGLFLNNIGNIAFVLQSLKWISKQKQRVYNTVLCFAAVQFIYRLHFAL